VPGTTELVRHEVNGLLAAPGDVGSLAAALDAMTRMPSPDRRRLGDSAAAQASAHFGMSAVLDQWEDLYARRLGQRGLTLSPH